ncbi:hypothetical protein NDU88_006552 [Pleurodeles waltl]|uniref:Uncharacterized protein n=1 Tax=Pleurodeles waltl TaxID=8319 RepID=A0AAV7NTT3_PLEWA|nr:hypothetical protein NDU88_006552 [Pleurodeles waltl]
MLWVSVGALLASLGRPRQPRHLCVEPDLDSGGGRADPCAAGRRRQRPLEGGRRIRNFLPGCRNCAAREPGYGVCGRRPELVQGAPAAAQAGAHLGLTVDVITLDSGTRAAAAAPLVPARDVVEARGGGAKKRPEALGHT